VSTVHCIQPMLSAIQAGMTAMSGGSDFCLVRLDVAPCCSCCQCSQSSLGRYVFGSEISYNKAPPRLPGLAC
jgi:hypothetical protein